MLQEKDIIPYTPSDIPSGPYLIFAPHPDDETIGMGGTIARATRAGLAVYVVVLTDGQCAGNPKKRRQEAKDASQVLGLTDIDFWGLPDRELHKINDIESRLSVVLESVKPNIVFLPSLQEFHPDHRAATSKIWSILQKLDYSGQLWTYEIARQAEANRLINITEVIPVKQQAMRCYKSQLALNNYEAVTLGLNQARTLTLQEGITHAEAFFKHDGWQNSCPYTASLTRVKSYWRSGSMATDFPLVSVIIRTKDRPRLLREALTSVAEQTYPNIEAVVVNDGGQDVESVVRDFRGVLAKIQYVQHEVNRGRPAAANTGIQKAEGEWICFLDDDDLYTPLAVEFLVASATEDFSSIVYGQVEARSFRSNGSPDSERYTLLFAQPFDRELLLCCNYIPFNAIICHRSVFDAVGLLDETLSLFEDWDFFLRASERYEFKYIPELIGEYRTFYSSTISGNRFSQEHNMEVQDRIWDRHWDKITSVAIRKYTDYLVHLHVSAMERQLYTIKGEQEDHHRKDLSVRDALLRDNESRIEKLSKELTEITTSRDALLRDNEPRIEKLSKELTEITAAHCETEDLLQRILGSVSWRITAPLRFVRASANKFSARGLAYRTARNLPLPITLRNRLRGFYYQHLAAKPSRHMVKTNTARPLVSVLIPVYNHAVYLRKCISSIFAQTYSNFEVIIIDDASTDPSVKAILDDYKDKPRCKVLYNSSNMGISKTQNRGLMESQGTHIAFVDCDDFLGPEALETVVSMWRPETRYAYSDRIYVNEQDEEAGRVSFSELPREDYLREQLDGKMYTSHLKMIHRDVFAKAGLFDSRFDAAQDYDFLMRAAFHFPSSSFLHVPRFIYFHRWHKQQETVQRESKQQRAVELINAETRKRMAIRDGSWDKMLTFLVLSYGKEDQTLQCIQSIKKTVKVPHEIILWDNGSRPETVNFLKRYVEPIEGVRIFYSEKNFGPAAGRMKALAHVRGDYIMSLDNDIELCDGWLEEIIVRAEEDPEIGAVCCRVAFPNGSLQFTGGKTRQQGLRLSMELYDQGKSIDDLSTLQRRELDWLPIGATLYKGDLPLKPGYPNVFEDIAVSFGLKEKGRKLVNSPASFAIHHHIMFDHRRSSKETDYLAFRYDPRRMLQSVKSFYECYGLIIDDEYVLSVNGLIGKPDDQILQAFRGLGN
ncbi:MAG: glycosyltransferase [Deltaproteobacteria bacterium]|nr:glycosyltransferase [Deltaproteobacteria bacterium]